MDASSISTLAGSGGALSGANKFSDLTSDDFVKVMIAELSHQDPFQPQDSSKLLEQFSSLRNVESQLKLQESLSSLVLQNQVASAGGLIGKLVAGLDLANQDVAGLVTAVRVQDGQAVLELDNGKTLPMERVTEIANLPVG